MRPASLDSRILVMLLLSFTAKGADLTYLSTPTEWDAAWPLAYTSKIEAIHWSNLVDAVNERLYVTGRTLLAVTQGVVVVSGTNAVSETNVFGSTTVVSTRYTETFATNVLTNVFIRPSHNQLKQIDASIFRLYQSVDNDRTQNQDGPEWAAPYMGDTNSTLGALVSLTNAAGAYPFYWPWEVGFSGGGSATGKYFLVHDLNPWPPTVATDEWGLVTWQSGSARSWLEDPYQGNTYTLLAQGWVYNDGANTMVTRAVSTNTVNELHPTIFPRGQRLSPDTPQAFQYIYKGTNFPTLHYQLGGTNEPSSLVLGLEGWVQQTNSARPTSHTKTSNQVTITASGNYTLSNAWNDVTNIVIVSGTPGNVSTGGSFLGGDYIAIDWDVAGGVYSQFPPSSDITNSQWTGSGYYPNGEMLNHRFHVVDAMRVLAADSQDATETPGDRSWTTNSLPRFIPVGEQHVITTSASDSRSNTHAAAWSRATNLWATTNIATANNHLVFGPSRKYAIFSTNNVADPLLHKEVSLTATEEYWAFIMGQTNIESVATLYGWASTNNGLGAGSLDVFNAWGDGSYVTEEQLVVLACYTGTASVYTTKVSNLDWTGTFPTIGATFPESHGWSHRVVPGANPNTHGEKYVASWDFAATTNGFKFASTNVVSEP